MPKSNEISINPTEEDLLQKVVAEYFTDDADEALRSYFGKVRVGQPNVYDTPFAEGESTDHMLHQWLEFLESSLTDWPSLLEYEKEMASKVGPMSVMKPLRERMEDIEHYYTDILLPSEPISHSALTAVLREWNPGRGLIPRSQGQTVDNMKLSTNSGSPYFSKRRDVLKETIPNTIFHDNTRVYQHLSQGDWRACAVLGWRGQEGGDLVEDVKQRVVWMFPFGVNTCELQVYQPLIWTAQNFQIVPAWNSMESVDRRITYLFDTKESKDPIICTDFSKFDQHFNSDMQNAAHDILAGILTKDDPRSRAWLIDVFPVKYIIPLMYDYGRVRTGAHGMGSGSGGTNADETLAHRALQYEAAIQHGAKLNLNSQCLGDDGVLSYPGITVEDVIETYESHGQEMNPDKQYVSDNECIYLRRWHHNKYRLGGICVGVYSTCRALGRLRYLERFYNPSIWNEKMVALRQLSILENVKYHPARNQFVEFCMKRDKYRLGIDIPGFLDNIVGLAKEAIDHMPDFMGYTKTLQDRELSGIGSWWIVNYLKSCQ